MSVSSLGSKQIINSDKPYHTDLSPDDSITNMLYQTGLELSDLAQYNELLLTKLNLPFTHIFVCMGPTPRDSNPTGFSFGDGALEAPFS